MNKIRVMGRDVKIVKKQMDDWGNFDCDKNIIYVRNNLSKKEFKEVVKHELLHAVLFYSGQSFNINSESLEEGIVRCIEYNYLTLLNKVK